MLEKSLQTIAAELHGALDKLLPAIVDDKEKNLIEAMRYSCLSGGKRLRPFLTVVCAQLFGVGRSSSLHAASAIEMIHAYSLIHDDLPALDNDDMRRGQPSCHKKFNEATAILAGNALLTLAFEIIVRETLHPDPSVRCELVTSLAKATGYNGMIAGQMIDLNAENNELDFSDITRMQQLKTGALFAVSCEAGAILGKAPHNLRTALRYYAHDIGLAFQITDDLLDKEEETNITKTGGPSVKNHNFVSFTGEKEARERAAILAAQAKTHLEVFDERADLLRDLADFIVNRSK